MDNQLDVTAQTRDNQLDVTAHTRDNQLGETAETMDNRCKIKWQSYTVDNKYKCQPDRVGGDIIDSQTTFPGPYILSTSGKRSRLQAADPWESSPLAPFPRQTLRRLRFVTSSSLPPTDWINPFTLTMSVKSIPNTQTSLWKRQSNWHKN